MSRQGTPITGLTKLWEGYTEAVCEAFSIPKSSLFSSESNLPIDKTLGELEQIREKAEVQSQVDKLANKIKASI